MFNNKYTENIQNETGIRSIEIRSVGIIVLITVDLIRCDMKGDNLYDL